MDAYRVLIVEDDPLVSMHLETIVVQTLDSRVSVATTVAQAFDALEEKPSFAFLDVDVLDGKTYAFASRLSEDRIPFAFVSASSREEVPLGLQSAPFVEKPYEDGDIVGLIRSLSRTRD